MLPCQDAPSVKVTYTATVEVPEPLSAVMSALPVESATSRHGWRVFSFRQPVPMSSYLIALAVGHLSSRDIGPRVSEWETELD
jgi:leukotriene-A4 hydrolase